MTEGATARRRILIVDDERRIRDNLATLLGGGPHEIVTADDGAAAIVELERNPADLVLTDIMMPGVDGFSLLDWLRSNSPRTLIIVVTGYGSMESTIKAMRMGAFDYLVKPFDFELLQISVDRAMRRIEADRASELAQRELALWSEQLKVVNQIGRRAAGTLSEHNLLELVARSVHEEFGYHHVYFAMLTEDRASLLTGAQAGAYEGKMPADHRYAPNTGITGKAIETGQIVLVNDVAADSDYYEVVPETRSQISLPIRADGRVIGALSVESVTVGSFDQRDIALLETLADMVASSIATVRLFEEVKETKDYLEVLVASSADAIVTTDTKGIVSFFSPGAENVYGYAAAEVVGLPVAKFYADGAVEAEKIMDLLLEHERLKDHETVLRARDGRPVYASLSASLLRDRSGKILGTLGVSKDITKRVELERKLTELTITDGLTGLYNQRHFFRELNAEIERARRQKRNLVLMLFDLDHFKRYNDSQGHLEGDALLKEIGRRVQESIRNVVDSAYRYGGDEFTILLPDLAGEQATRVVGRIKSSIEEGLPGGITISVGLVALRPEMSAEDLIRLADEAMYERKKLQDGRIVLL